MNPFRPKHQPDDATEWLRRGQASEASGTPVALNQAIHCYRQAIALLQPGNAATTRTLAIAWMNRGNALQKQPSPHCVHEAVRAYDTAISLLQPLFATSGSELGNSLGAAWLNRGHALHQLPDTDSHAQAARSFAQAVDIFSSLPVASSLVYQLNLAGAQMNLAHALLDTTTDDRWLQAHAAADSALQLTARHELGRAGFADIGFKARRVLCEVIGQWLITCTDRKRQDSLIAKASDIIDSGMALARRWESQDVSIFHPLATRLFRFGTAFYRRHQPHFLADFVLENLDPGSVADTGPITAERLTIAREALTAAREDLRTQHPVIAGDATTARRLEALHDIESVLVRLPVISATNRAPISSS